MSNKNSKKPLNAYVKLALTAGSAPSQDDLFQILFYVRQVVGIVAGVLAGMFGLTGLITILSFLALNCLITYAYSYGYLKADEDKIEQKDLFTEGLVISTLNFNIFWILCYTFVYLKATVPLPATLLNADL